MPTRKAIVTSLFFTLVAGACAADPVGSDASSATQQELVDGTPEAVGVLGFLNHETTTLQLLDIDAALHATAAKNLVAHRDGADATFGTPDDDLFDDVAEVLGVPQIGPARLKQLTDYAAANGWVPQGGDLLGVYDGVPFTVDEAEAVLAFVNAATFAQLDDEVGLDRRAAESIVEQRPIATILELSERYYVGKSALNKLKEAAGATGGVPEGGDCESTEACESDLYCEGIPFDGSPEIGKCVDPNLDIPGYWDDCGQYQPCNDGLECIGMTAFGGEGWCAYPWMLGTYETTGPAQAIPDADANGTSMDVVVYGQATVPMDIMVTLDIDHPRPADLVVTLASTNGSDSVLWNNDGSPDYYLPANGIERDNYINGTLTLHVVDSVTGETGMLNGFKLLVSSRFD